ncbi:hypothetical protein SAMN06296273_0736 [Nitrosomonas ureae]|uniref:Uncharacterized protein n=1 Tax=Nitrosomonas ureae TaxID=44577 RepID=A0A285BWK5_9PROT|nr:hypothetical protein [Nitrosomonas ureae]SNX59296.1 hypothetical protein SAMN06296273_0736 [Nitrosomonas ureae]
MFKKNEMTGLQLQDYYESYQIAREGIVDSISKLRNRNRQPNVSPGEVAENDRRILVLTADKALLDAKLAAFDANKDAINPPSTAQLDLLKQLIAAVDKLNTNQKILDEIIKLSTDALTEFNKIHPNQA